MRTRFIRSAEIEQEQIRVIMESDVDMMACGIGAPQGVVKKLKTGVKPRWRKLAAPSCAPGAQAGVEIIVAGATTRVPYWPYRHLFSGAANCRCSW